MIKKTFCLLLAVLLLFSLSGCREILAGGLFLLFAFTSDDRADKSDIFEFVSENEAALLEAIETGDFSAFENQGFIGRIDADEAVVDFSCGGAGLGSGTAYAGFFYTPEQDMSAVWCAPSSGLLVPAGNGYEWTEPGGDNRYYTEHICGNFYYYTASF